MTKSDNKCLLAFRLREIFQGVNSSNEIGKERLAPSLERRALSPLNEESEKLFRQDGKGDVPDFIK
jgi:hypothetical protein